MPKTMPRYRRTSYQDRDFAEVWSGARTSPDRCDRCGLMSGKDFPATNRYQVDDTECFSCGASWFEVPSVLWEAWEAGLRPRLCRHGYPKPNSENDCYDCDTARTAQEN